MSEKLIDRLTQSRAATRGLICIPSDLDAELIAQIQGTRPISLDRWFELPRNEQAPRVAVAIYRCSADVLTIAIFDVFGGRLHAVIEGKPEELPRFEAEFECLCKRPGVLANLKPPSDPPPTSPKISDQPDSATGMGMTDKHVFV